MMVAIYITLGVAAASGLGLLVGAFLRWWAPLDVHEPTDEERRAALSTYLEGP